MSNAPMEVLRAVRLSELARRLAQFDDFAEVVAAVAEGKDATLDGVSGSSCALAAAAFAGELDRRLVVICPTPDDVDFFQDDFSLFSELSTVAFPAWESEPGERVVQDDIFGDRLRVLKSLLRSAAAAPAETALPNTAPGDTANAPDQGESAHATGPFVTSVQSLLQPTPAVEDVDRATQFLSTGQQLDVDDLLRWLAENRFHSTSAVELPGEFSSRGGIIDIFAPDWQQPVRIELFDDQIESIRQFDIRSQRSLQSLRQIELTVLQPSRSANRGHFLDYLPADCVFLLAEPAEIAEQAKQYLKRLEHPEHSHSFEEVMQRVAGHPVVSASSIAQGELGVYCRLPVDSVERFSGEIDRVRDELDRIGDGQRVIIVAQTDAEIERLGDILKKTRLAATGRLQFAPGCLRQGFRLTSERTTVITGGELFHHGELRRLPKRRLGKAIDSFLDLREGDLVVHLTHGIGRYRGLELLDKDGHVEEHLRLEFHGGTKIFVPTAKIGLVQKYVGGSKSRPSLAKIGSKTWVRQKQAAEKAVVDLAADMLQMQAERASRPGIAFKIESEWQREFDASFPYQETPDQQAAIAAIKENMTAGRPMDRLLCGDVGFGKTEVAMRAAFKAIDNGYQVALLAPTTVLVEQHFHTFRNRMAEFPFDIARLSRFCTTTEQRETLQRLRDGQIDIVIGTHRLASRDVRFHNLGLVIIDEEQRFGVEVKERLKTLRSSVDILTMTATPIPRTLHMSLVGVRDISNLETPPEDRVAVETRVTRANNELIRHAVLRELNRGGQIYFVHNRVGDIRVVEERLKQMVPEARIRVGHGQMAEAELERVMVGFVEHQFDLLLATTIVESGLDIPNANTIFIDEADRYGLADLHQLRGRVGRYKHRAYCYLLVDPFKHVTPTAAKRLRAIEEFSDMGAGFAISMRDLEIRGAGNLLGTQQSGHISAVGYELYCQLLESAVRQLKHMPPKLSIEVDIELPGQAYLPSNYVPDLRLKIDIYRRLSRITGVDQLHELRDELVDRFGPLPPPVQQMLALTELKIDAAIWQINEIFLEDRYIVFRYSNRSRIEHLAKLCKGRLRIVDQRSAYLPMGDAKGDPGEIFALAKSVLQAG